MNEQLKDFLKKASEDESIKDELKALEGLSAEENAEQAAAIAQKAGFDLSAEDFALHRRNSMKTSWAPSPEAKPAAASTPVWAWLTTAGRCANARHGNGNSEGYRRDLRDHFHLPLYGGGRLGADATAAALAWAGVLEEPPPVAACETP